MVLYLACFIRKCLVMIIITSIRTVKKTRCLLARYFRLAEEIKNWNMMRADKVMRPFFQVL
jgi:hypothetical protein